jgi:hypothetical protein
MFLYAWRDNQRYTVHAQSKMTSLRYGLDGPEFESQQEQRVFLFPKTVHIVFGAHPASYSMVTGIVYRRQSGGALRLTTHTNYC